MDHSVLLFLINGCHRYTPSFVEIEETFLTMLGIKSLIYIFQKKEYEVALVGAFRREKDKDTALQTLAAEHRAAIQLVRPKELTFHVLRHNSTQGI